MSARSMTGFARARRIFPRGEVSISLKAVNHRSLDVHFHLPPEFDPFENAMRAEIRKAVIRGHVDVRAVFVPAVSSAGGLNVPLFRAWLSAWREAAAEAGLRDVPPDLSSALRVSGMLAGDIDSAFDDTAEGDILSVLAEALDELNRFRAREGAALVAAVRQHNEAISARADELQQLRSQAMPLLQDRLQERLRELLRGTSPDPQRLLQEAATLADRSDISEEIARLRIHATQLTTLLDSGGELGKKLDFLLQEMNRETNTILSKTGGIGDLGLRITDLALATKADIEKIREQALNLE